MSNTLVLSAKYKAFMKHVLLPEVKAEFLEGTTAAGKSTVGAVAFLLRVAASKSDKASAIACLTSGVAEKNIIFSDLGLADVFGDLITYHGNGSSDIKLPHLKFKTPNGTKIVYVLGYADKARWKIALGSQMDCLFIDECNVADIDFVREATMRSEFVMTTSNPDDPNLPIYAEYINRARPLPEYDNDAPAELRAMLNQTPHEGWFWWFFNFSDNIGIPEARKKQIIDSVPVGSKLYFNKIMGLRRKATGLVFSNFEHSRHVIMEAQAKEMAFVKFSAGLDTAYSSKSPDTISMSYIGITADGKCVVLEERVYNNRDLSQPFAPTDTVKNYIDFLDRCRDKWGGCRDSFIDSADQATITEFAKYKRQNGSIYSFAPAWKKMKIVDRINAQLGWLAKDQFLVVDTCRHYINELDIYSWREDKDLEPEDGNDHMINSVQYAWIPFISKIGEK